MLALAAACVITGHIPFTRPDTDCTPGASTALTRQQVCAPKDRPTLRAADRRLILAEHGLSTWTGADGELDHRIPVFLGGLTVEDNIWPEQGPIPNPKDRLEFRVYRRVCFRDPYGLRPVTARRIFRADWVATYRSWKAQRIL